MSSTSWVLITGGNRGLGFLTAKKLVTEGHSVIIGARSQASADEAAQKLGKETGHPERLAALAVDVSDAKSIEAAAQTLEQDYAGKLGGLINNAGVSTQEVSEEEFKRVWATNVIGLFNFSRALAPIIAEGGHIVHVASTLGQLDGIPLEGVKAYISDAKSIKQLIDMPYPADEIAKMPSGDDMGSKYLIYNMSKAAVLHGTQMEVADPAFKSRRVSVAAICPGWCRTDMGTENAPRPAEDGAKAISWAFTSSKARESQGGFFQDNRKLSIVDLDPDRFGPAKWVEE